MVSLTWASANTGDAAKPDAIVAPISAAAILR
jgi:hypothetical protein